MTPGARGLLAGIAAGLLLAGLTGGTQVEAFVRVTAGGPYLLDTRVDESAVGRIVNVPVASLGEVSVLKRSWIVASTYAFSLRIRPEVMPEPGRPLSGLQVSVRLPGRVIATNAPRVAAGSALWDMLPPDALLLRTVTVHWVRVVILAAVAVVAIIANRTIAPRPDRRS